MTAYPSLQLYINGEWKSADGQPVINPADESVLGTVPHASKADLDAALAAAEQGFRVWSATSPAKRAEMILKAARLIRERVEEMAVAMTLEQGKPIAQSRLEILRGCDIIEWDATEGRRIYGRVIPSEPGLRHTVYCQPIGVVAAFSPWNFPMSSPAQGGRCALGRLLDHSEDFGRDAGRRGTARARLPRCRFAARRAQPRVRRPVRRFRTSDPAAFGAPRHLHRLDSGRQAARRDGRPLHEAGDHGAWRPRAGRRLRRRRPGGDRGNLGHRQDAQCWASVRRADALLRAGGDLRALRQCLRREGGRHQGRRRP